MSQPIASTLDRPAIEGGAPVRPHDRFLVFGAPHLPDADIAAVVDCMKRRWIGTGPKVHAFEKAFAAYKQAAHAVAVSSCTAAMHLAMIALGIGKGDEVITTPMTFCSTVNSILHTGATPVLADCHLETQTIDPERIERCITERTRAILLVHLLGRACEMDEIVSLAQRHGLLIIEDCAHAVETEYRGRKVGTIGNVGCFSFYVTKNITTGEGGMVLTADAELADKIKVLALHGLTRDAWRRFSDSGYRHYEVVGPGFKYNMTDINAAIGLGQLERVETYWQRRQDIWKRYNHEFSDLPCFTPADYTEGRHAYHLYTPLLDLERLRIDRDRVLEALTAENIGVGVHYLPVHLHPFYAQTFGFRRGDFANAEYIGDRTLSLPLSGSMTDADVDDVCAAFRRILNFYQR